MKTMGKDGSLGALTLGALGVVFGDIGTSPIYALRESLHTAGTELYDIYGVVSLIFWSLMLVVTLKYLVFVLRADNNGEGGILSLFALLPNKVRNATGGTRYLFVVFLLLGTALLVADGMLTPAISVLSATEGLETLNPDLVSWTVPLTVLILLLLFGFQYKGSNTLGKIFGPIILLWFITLGTLGVLKVKEHPEVIEALHPHFAIDYIAHHGFHTFIILSSVILAITGAEALYADLGHFGKRPIRIGWIFIVAPSLVLNYLGQAVIAVQNPGSKKSLFFALAPSHEIRIYLVALATLATIIASQALITGVASLSRQAVRLGLLPRIKVVHTSSTVVGQIYVPAINLFVGLGSVFLVIFFKTSSALASAYSFAISATMLMTTIAFGYVAAEKFKWSKRWLYIMIPILLIIDLSFFLATVTKVLKGAWVPLAIGITITYVMLVWRKGQTALEVALRKQEMTWDEVEEEIKSGSISIIPDTGIYLSSMASGGVTRTNIDEGDIDSILSEAKAAALAAGEAEDFAPLAKDVSFGNWSAPHIPTGPEVFSTFAPDLGEMMHRSKSDAIELFGYAEHTHESLWVGSKGGMRLRHDSPIGRVEMTGKSHQRSRSTWNGVETHDFKDVSVATIDAAIRQRLAWQAKKIDLPAGRYDTIFPSGSIADIYVYMMWVSGGRDAFEGQSVFSKNGGGTRVGEKLSNVGFQLFSDPAHPRLGGSPFVSAAVSDSFSSVFDNGEKKSRVDWFKDGVLQSLVQTRASAKLTSLPYTPMGDNLIMSVDGGSGNLEDLIRKVDHGLLLTTLWYIRMVDPNTLLLTGLTRDGVYYVKDGEVQGSTNNFRWNDSPVSALSRISHAGSTEWTQPREWAGDVTNMSVPPMVIKDFNMSTVSPGN